jgi:hypothetical protein
MCIKDYETEIGGQSPVRAVELLPKINLGSNLCMLMPVLSSVRSMC